MDVRVENHPGFPSDLYVDGELLAKVDPAVGDVVEDLAARAEARRELCARALRFLAPLRARWRDEQKEFGFFEGPLSFSNQEFAALLADLGAAVGQVAGLTTPAHAGRVIERVELAEIRADGAMRFTWAATADDPLQGLLWLTGAERPAGVQVGARGRLVYESTGSHGLYYFEPEWDPEDAQP